MRFCYSLLPICYFNMLNTLQMCLYTTCMQFPWKPIEGVWVSGTHMALSSHVGVENWILASWERQRAHAWRTWLEHGRGPNTDDQGHFRKVEASRQWQRLVNQDEEPSTATSGPGLHHKSDFTQNMDVIMLFVRDVLLCLRDGNSIEGSADNGTVILTYDVSP